MKETKAKAAVLKQQVNNKLKEIQDHPEIKQKIEILKAEIERSGVSEFKDLDHGLKEKVLNVKKEVESEFANVLKSLDLDVQIVKPIDKAPTEESLPGNLRNKFAEVNEEIHRTIDETVKSSDLKNKIEELRSLVRKSGESPNAEQQNKIEALVQQIKESLQNDLRSSEAVTKLAELKAEVSEGSKNVVDPVIG